MRVSLATRIFLGYLAVLGTFAAVSLFGVSAMHENQSELRLISQGYLPLAQDAAALEAFHSHQRRDTARLVEEKSPDTRRSLIRLARLYTPATLSQHTAVARDSAEKLLRWVDPDERETLHDLVGRLDTLVDRSTRVARALERLYSLLEVDEPSTAALTPVFEELRTLDEATGRDLRALRAFLDNRVRELAHEAERRERRTGIAIIGLSIFAIVVGLLATFLSARTLAPVRSLTEGVARIARGDFSAELGLRGEDEISKLGRGFDAMASALRQRDEQLRQQQEALLRAEQLAAVGRVAAQIAHEVRNPLSSIGLNVELLQDSLGRMTSSATAEDREVQALLASVLKEVDRVTEITESYLGMARLPQPALAAEDVNVVLSEVLDFSSEELARAQVSVVRDFESPLPRAMADERQLRQVFLNLVRNAREAMVGGGTLRIASRRADAGVEISFVDTGPGIEAAAQQRIFEPFFSTKKNGTGLGLAVSQHILKAHGGSIECRSELGRGTTFNVRLSAAAS